MRLGEFELERKVSSGTMGDVWRGRHSGQDIPVAVKVLPMSGPYYDFLKGRFKDEVRSVARLDHPGIVMVLDCGEVIDDTIPDTPKGSPFFVMEWVGGGTLDDVDGELSWTAFRGVMLDLLDALAHAHARGVVHRDLKPANVLLGAPDDLRKGLRLSDFGIAHLLDSDRAKGDTALAGTPHYMAPEQFQGRWRDYGPWTDLYALGCLAFRLLTGQPPFRGTPADLAVAHLTEVPPELALLGAPRGLDAWVARLLAKAPRERFSCAADAAWSLASLPQLEPLHLRPPGLAALIERSGGLRSVPTHSPVTIPIEKHARIAAVAAPTAASGSTGQGADLTDAPPASIAQPDLPRPLPVDWRADAEATRPPLTLSGAGLRLFGLRRVPFVGRDAERDLIWNALSRVNRSGRAEMLLLTGVAGVGKTTLVKWMAQRARELGAATVLTATHGKTDILGVALARMLVSFLGCAGLTADAARERLEKRIGSEEYEGEHLELVSLMLPSLTDTKHARRTPLSSPRQRHGVLFRLFRRLGHRRPVILILDDVQWGFDSLGFADYLLKRAAQLPCPVLVLATLSRTSLGVAPVIDAIREVLPQHCTRQVEIAPLETDEHHDLVRRLLGLDDSLVAEVAERTEGNPLFAVQLVGDWVQRGVLSLGERGFQLREGESGRLPDDIHQVWRMHLEHTLRAHPAEAAKALEMAAVLGHEVRMREWQALPLGMDEAAMTRLVADLAGRRLATAEEAGWSFIHGMLRESLLRAAAESGREVAHHFSCAQALRGLYANGTPLIAERVGRHLYSAQRYGASLEPLLRGASERVTTGDYDEALSVLAVRDRGIREVGERGNVRYLAESELLRARIYRLRGESSPGVEAANNAIQLARDAADDALIARAVLVRGKMVHHWDGDFPRAERLYRLSLSLSRGIAERGIAGDALCDLAFLALDRGTSIQAASYLRKALAHYRRCSDEDGCNRVLVLRAKVHVVDAEWSRALRLLECALPFYEARGDRWRIGDIRNELGEIYRFCGEYDLALENYERARCIDRAIGADSEVWGEANIALVKLAQGYYDEARDTLERVSRETKQRGGRHHPSWIPLMACAAGQGDWSAWRRFSTNVPVALHPRAEVNPDDPWAAQIAARLALEAGHQVEAELSLEIALSRWKALGRADEVLEVQRALAECQIGFSSTLPGIPFRADGSDVGGQQAW